MRGKLVLALFGVAMMVASAATANHATFSFTLSDTSAGANSDGTSAVDYGTDHPTTGTTHLDEGFLVAHANDSQSPLSPPPQNGDIVGQGESTGNWKLLFCGRSTLTFDAKWVEPIGTGAPSGAVARIDLVTSLGFTVNSYVVEVTASSGDDYTGAPHYDLVVPDFGDRACAGSDVDATVTTYGTVPGSSPTRYVSQNPSSTGTYTIWSVYIDESGGKHEASDTVTIT